MKHLFYEVTQFIFFLIAITALSVVYILYAVYVILDYLYRKIMGEV